MILRSIDWEKGTATYQDSEPFKFGILTVPLSEVRDDRFTKEEYKEWLTKTLSTAVRYQTGKHKVRPQVARRLERQLRALTALT